MPASLEAEEQGHPWLYSRRSISKRKHLVPSSAYCRLFVSIYSLSVAQFPIIPSFLFPISSGRLIIAEESSSKKAHSYSWRVSVCWPLLGLSARVSTVHHVVSLCYYALASYNLVTRFPFHTRGNNGQVANFKVLVKGDFSGR